VGHGRLLGLVMVGAALLLLMGCGGGGEDREPTGCGCGSVGVKITWPERPAGVETALIPAASNSIKVEVIPGAAGAPTHTATINRPDTEARIDGVEAGAAVLQATAYPQAGAAGVAQARAETNINVVAGAYTEWPLTLASTIDHVDVTPNPAAVDVGDTVALAATAKNADGETVLVGGAAPFGWAVQSGDTHVTVDAAGVVTGTSAGQAVVRATEQESDVSGTATVNVTEPLQPPTVDLTADPDTIALGEASTLQWTSTNATEVVNSNFGATTVNGTLQVTPTETTTYTITVGGPGGQAADTAQVTVTLTPTQGKIAFDTDRDGNTEIYVMNPDGSDQTRITNNPAADYDPAWSFDGSQIAFVSSRDANSEIYKMNADGSGQTRLTNNAATDDQPAWSPDGSQIAFVSRRDGNDEIYVMNADGSGQTRLTAVAAAAGGPLRLTDTPATDGGPAWSPDGSKIAFHSERDGNSEIYTMNPDGTNVTRLSYTSLTDREPAWHPAGTTLAVSTFCTCNGRFQIYVSGISHWAASRITYSYAFDVHPSWSPDGNWIAFERQGGATNGIFTIGADRSGQVHLTDGRRPSWSWAGP